MRRTGELYFRNCEIVRLPLASLRIAIGKVHGATLSRSSGFCLNDVSRPDRLVYHKARREPAGAQCAPYENLRVLHLAIRKFSRPAQLFRCAKSQRAGFKPAPTKPTSFLRTLRSLRLNLLSFVVIDPLLPAGQSRLLTHIPSHQPVSGTIREACTRRRDTAGDSL